MRTNSWAGATSGVITSRKRRTMPKPRPGRADRRERRYEPRRSADSKAMDRATRHRWPMSGCSLPVSKQVAITVESAGLVSIVGQVAADGSME